MEPDLLHDSLHLYHEGSYLYPFHEESTRCGECKSIISIRFRCHYATSSEGRKPPSTRSQTRFPNPSSDIKDFQSKQMEGPLFEKGQDGLKEQRRGLAKYLPIGEQFEESFDSGAPEEGQVSDGEDAAKTRTVELTNSEWLFLRDGRRNQLRVKQLVTIRNKI